VKWLLLFVGGGLGASLRFALAAWVDQRVPVPFPWGTFAVNAVGCFAIGLLATYADEHDVLSAAARLFLVAGLLGGFTTFSTFGLETWQLIEDRAVWTAAAYALGSLATGLVAVILGVLIARELG
jgi:CrcB protein